MPAGSEGSSELSNVGANVARAEIAVRLYDSRHCDDRTISDRTDEPTWRHGGVNRHCKACQNWPIALGGGRRKHVSTIAEVLRDAIQAIQREHDERDREIVAMRAAMIEHHIPLIHVESSARGPSPLRAESVRIVSREDEQGITIIGPQGPISSERTKR